MELVSPLLNVEDLALWTDLPTFTREGAFWGKLNEVFGGELEKVISEINTAIAELYYDRNRSHYREHQDEKV